MTGLYEPREDSFLLSGVVKRFCRGKVLDMGTGTGDTDAGSPEERKGDRNYCH